MKPKKTGLDNLQPPKKQPPAQAWMLTFADLTSLLLCFFILFYATLTIDRPTWQALVGSFTATFAPSALAVAVVPRGQLNAMPVVRTRRGVGYLDNVLRQNLRNDPAWQSLRGTETLAENAFIYAVPTVLQDINNPAVAAAWQRLGAMVRNWQTNVAVRVVTPAGGNMAAASAQALALAQAAAAGGGRVTAEVRRGTIPQVLWVLYGAD